MGGNAEQYMSVVFGSVYRVRHESALVRTSAYVSPQAGLELLQD